MSPRIGVVVVNYNGGELTMACLRSVLGSSWPTGQLELVLVDNASSDGVAARVRTELPMVTVIESVRNDGFGAGCNLGIRALGTVDHVALVNNDAVVEPGWLEPLVAALDADPAIGAACPKIRFAGRFGEIRLRASTIRRSGGDHRDLGVLLHHARVDGQDVWPRIQLVDGFWGVEPGADEAQWSRGDALLRVPVIDGRVTCSLLLSGPMGSRVELETGVATSRYELRPEACWYEVDVEGPGEVIINNAGVRLEATGFAADRGYQEADDGRWDTAADVDAWCGAAVLLRGAYLDDVGLFDEHLFLYYEDVELSLRGAARGWRYRFVPQSRVEHVHSASSGKGSAFKRYFDERNRLLVLARHGRSREVLQASARSLLVTASYARRDMVAPALTRSRMHPEIVGERLRAFGGFARRLPATIARRRHDARPAPRA